MMPDFQVKRQHLVRHLYESKCPDVGIVQPGVEQLHHRGTVRFSSGYLARVDMQIM